MKAASIALVSLALAAPLAAPLAASCQALAADLGRPPLGPFASATLYFDAVTGGVSIVEQTNVALTILPAQYQDLTKSRAFYVECRLAPNDGLRSIGVWADTPAHIIPADVVDYHDFDPGYVELDLDTVYFENRSNDLLFNNHEIHIEFFEKP